MRMPRMIENQLARWGYSRAVEIKLQDAAAPKKSNILKAVLLKFKANVASRNSELVDPEYDLKTLRKAIDVESILRQAKEKYCTLMWKNGFSFVGKDASAVEFVKTRMSQIAIATNMPTATFLEQVAEELVTYHNAFIVVQRDASANGAKPYTNLFGKSVNPIVGLFLIPASHTQPVVDGKTKRLLAWKVSGFKDEDDRYFVAEDVIHVYQSKGVGNYLGSPVMIPVLDDVRALRKMEENAEALVYQHAIPLFQYKVGDKDTPTEDDDEVVEVQRQIENSDPHGMFVVPHHHTITAVGNGDSPIDVQGYLKYFRHRIISGLGLSDVVFGEGSTSNRGTAGVQDKGLQDGTKKYLSTIKTFIDSFVINEFLQEAGKNIMDPNDQVHLFTPEIDVDAKIAKENHVMGLYQGNCITESEMRTELGMDPIDEGKRQEMYWNLVLMPKAIILASDELYSQAPSTKAKAGLDIPKGTANKIQPTNQFGTKKTSAPKKNDSQDSERVESDRPTIVVNGTRLLFYGVTSQMDQLMGKMLKDMSEVKEKQVDFSGRLKESMNSIHKQTRGIILSSFTSGYTSVNPTAETVDTEIVRSIDAKYEEFLQKMGSDATILLGDLVDKKVIQQPPSGEAAEFKNEIVGNDVISIFDTLKYRVAGFASSIISMAYNTGVYSANFAAGEKVSMENTDGDCHLSNVVLDGPVDLTKIPPHGPNCKCKLQVLSQKERK